MEEPLLPVSTPSPDTSAAVANLIAVDPACRSLSTNSIAVRLATLAFIAIVSVWANHEASKGFRLTIANDAAIGTDIGRLIDLNLVSNGRASRMALEASDFIERTLYPDQTAYPKKPVDDVTIRLAGHNHHPSTVVVSQDKGRAHSYTLHLRLPLVVAGARDSRKKMESVIFRGMARVWLWDGRGTVPEPVLEAVSDRLSALAGHYSSSPGRTAPFNRNDVESCFNGTANRIEIGRLLRFCEGRHDRFLAKLNRAMRASWEVSGDELGSPQLQKLCEADGDSELSQAM